ncbi:MAG: dipeptidase [Saprospiraceae bacterium]|nr:dipeptidase [Saprospiraceae bacterium]MBK8451594.1 dipeptidase [Saprospiraceae bacterium]MBK9221070.1 dipeptidase [Saprospiraceae bacterium]MBK9722078.1 dipeptidase [Saprospiraceae bacterium]MBK9729125.1 dipeptidase [Saprospiraceae bacterium]
MNTNQYLESNKQRFLDELIELLKIPSVSADSKHNEDTKRCAEAVKQALLDAGCDTAEICKTKGHPVVYAQKIIDPNLPTVLTYGHYDVQPPDPLNLWTSGPFEPVVKDGKIYARGSCDDKGQVFMHIKALESMVKTNSLPCNIKYIIEGEEEVGSVNLGNFLKANKEKLKADIVLVSDTSMISMESPSIESGLRGLTYVEVEVTGPNRDLHSGVYGGAVANPITILAKMIASLHDKNNKIKVRGFYRDVVDLTPEERTALNKAPFSLENYKKDLEVVDVWGEEGYTTLERTGVRPTLELNGIWGGYTGEGAKTVLPSKAYAKISMRLVPNQKSKKIAKLFEKHFLKIAPPYVHVKVTELHGGEAAVTPTNSDAYLAAEKAIETTFGKKPIPTRGGGSIPIIALFEKTLGLKTVLMGFGLDSDNIHSPNEHFGLFNFYKGIETIPYFHKYYTELKKQSK